MTLRFSPSVSRPLLRDRCVPEASAGRREHLPTGPSIAGIERSRTTWSCTSRTIISFDQPESLADSAVSLLPSLPQCILTKICPGTGSSRHACRKKYRKRSRPCIITLRHLLQPSLHTVDENTGRAWSEDELNALLQHVIEHGASAAKGGWVGVGPGGPVSEHVAPGGESRSTDRPTLISVG